MGILPSDRLLETVTIKNSRKDKKNMKEKLYYTAAEIAQMIGVGRTTALLGERYQRNSLMRSISEEQEVRR